MSNKRKVISVEEYVKGFSKVNYEGDIFEYIRADKAPKVTQDITPEVIEPIAPEDSTDEPEDLTKYKKEELVELAQRFGYDGEVTKEVTKAILIDFINRNK